MARGYEKCQGGLGTIDCRARVSWQRQSPLCPTPADSRSRSCLHYSSLSSLSWCLESRGPQTVRTFEKCKLDRLRQLFSQEGGVTNPMAPRTKMAHTSLVRLLDVQRDSASPETLPKSASLDSSERRRRR